ncbi:mannose-6-phosphate isomerase [Fusarium mexicanum]|uniref:Mannose-6-phosphate isomerase n=1 Tax=Fusarium mexicanum TaxID=751941 RepID=A0A8H5N9R8_9HYPO|nr:mannose-6-phosphate isomerase [Fusarium mexicanum]
MAVAFFSSRLLASNLLSQGALDERDQYDSHGSSSPGDFVPGPVLEPGSGIPAYEVRSLPGSGKGVIALRSIKRDEAFLLDLPTILISWNLIGLFWDKTQESFLESALIHLPKDAKRRVLGLSRANLVPGLPLCDLFKTNVCGFVLGDETPHIGLFTEFAMEVVARDLYQLCSLCTAPELERATSDRYQRELEALRVDLDMAMRQRRWTDAAKHASQAVLKLSETEILAPRILDYSLTPLYLKYYEELERIYYKVGDVSIAKNYRGKAL